MEIQKVSFLNPNAGPMFVESLHDTGFAVLTDHPIPKEVQDGMYLAWSEFFRSPAKMEYKFLPSDQSGYFPFATEKAKDATVADLKEFFHIYRRSRLPDFLEPRSRALHHQLEGLASILLSWLDENAPAATRAHFSEPLTKMIDGSEQNLFRILHYPPLPEEETAAVRAAAHEDINLITLLLAASEPGLEVKDREGRWVPVACDPGDIIVNAGDMLQEASGGYFISTTHRVVNPTDKDARRKSRYSMPLFVHPRPEVRLSDRHTAGSYLEERLKEINLK